MRATTISYIPTSAQFSLVLDSLTLSLYSPQCKNLNSSFELFMFESSLLIALVGTLSGALFGITFISQISKAWFGVVIGAAAGMMSGCACVMFSETIGDIRSIVWLLMGILGMEFLNMFVVRFARKFRVFVLFFGLSVHSIAEGISLGLAAVRKDSLISLSLALHNFPEAAALTFAFKAKGLGNYRAVGLAVLSSFPQSLLAWPVVHWTDPGMFSGMNSIAAGCMAWIVAREVLPDAINSCGPKLAYSSAIVAALILIAFDVYSHGEIR